MAGLLRAPLVHFLLLGGLLLAVQSWRDVRPARPRIVLTAGDVAQLRDAKVIDWTAEHGAPPGPAGKSALIGDAVDEEILYREALAAGFDRAVGVRERLVRLAGFLGEDETQDRGALEREARRLGLERSDMVIRRHLVDMMRLAIRRPSPADLPTGADLEAYLARHAAEFAAPPTMRLTHVYLSAETRGDAAWRDAAVLLDELERTGTGPDAVAGRGDPFIRGPGVGPASRAELERVFGKDFAAGVEDALVGTWVGPVASSYGVHLVWLYERLTGRLPPPASVHSRLLLGVLEERGAARAAERMRALRARYDVDVEGDG